MATITQRNNYAPLYPSVKVGKW